MTTHDDRELVRSVLLRTGMYVFPPTYDTVCAFLNGFDCAKDGSVFRGFREWFQIRSNNCSNQVWIAHVASHLAPEVSFDELGTLSKERQNEVLKGLLGLFEEFWSDVDRSSIKEIVERYEQWHAERHRKPSVPSQSK